jgi:hypothetical protein
MPDVSEVALFPDRLEVNSAGQWVVLRFADMARWPRPAWLWRLLHRAGRRPRWLPVADRNWFRSPPDRYFAFYTKPRLVVYMPADEPREYEGSHFVRVKNVLAAGGFDTCDLG